MTDAVNALTDRWPALGRIPRVDLGVVPTSVHALSDVSQRLDAGVWVKRDDASAPRYGGNKVRKLEFVLAEARAAKADTLITFGAVGSHHVFATALYGREQGHEVHAVLTPQPYHPHVDSQLRADVAVGARLHSARSLGEALRKATRLALGARLRRSRPFVIPPGGSNVAGTLGCVNAGVELAAQIDAGQCPDPAAVYVACGTCATAAGIALGLAACGVHTKVVAVRVVDRLMCNRLSLSRLVRGAESFLRSVDAHFPEVAGQALASLEIDHGEFAPGYGASSPACEAAQYLGRLEGLAFDPTYTGKAFASLLRHAEGKRRGQNLLFWHTLSSAPLEPFLVDQPEAPEQFVRLMTLA